MREQMLLIELGPLFRNS